MGEYSKPGSVLLNGVQLIQSMTVKMSEQSNDKPVKTLALGLAGFSDGAEEVSIDISNAIPARGYEARFKQLCRGHVTVRVAFVIAGEYTECIGRFLSTDTETSVDNPNAQNVTFSGKVISESIPSQQAA